MQMATQSFNPSALELNTYISEHPLCKITYFINPKKKDNIMKYIAFCGEIKMGDFAAHL